VSEFRFRASTADDSEAIRHVLNRAFGRGNDDELAELSRAVADPARNLVALDGDRIVANAGAYTRDLTVPGAVLPAAHVTWVSVLPTYRRRGLLRALMTRQLRELHDAHREPVAVLWASESKIYQRYGYGLASYNVEFAAERREVAFLPGGPAGTGTLREALPGEVRKELAEVFERVRPTRPGWSSRSAQWWDRILHDPPTHRDGFSPRHALLYETADGCDGYAIWRTRMGWSSTGPTGTLEIREVVAATPEAYAQLWRFLFSVDLVRTVEHGMAAPDEPVTLLLDEPKVLGSRILDGLWLRIVDLPAALSARRYPVPVDVVLEVTDALLPENAGRWRLTDAGCAPTTDPADLALDIADLGAAYLGGTPLGTLAAAGRVRELSDGSLAGASAAFSWTRQPVSIEIF
jgi:predicted acetyltransferase